MKKLLIITSSPKHDSMSNKLAKAFAKEVEGKAITFLDISKIEFPNYSEPLLKKLAGEEVTDVDEKAVIFHNKLHDQFIQFDEYVFAFPNWNLMCPPNMVNYMLSAMRVGTTFKYTEDGSVGLLKNRKALIINASGGCYTENETSLGVDWMKQALLLMGIEEQYKVIAEGMEIPPLDFNLIEAKGIAELKEIAQNF